MTVSPDDAPRPFVREMIMRRGLSMAAVSLAIGRNPSWMHQWLAGRIVYLPLPVAIRLTIVLDVPLEALTLEATSRPLADARLRDPGNIPTFNHADPIDPRCAGEWTPRPSILSGAGALAAVWCTRDTDRLRTGDLVILGLDKPARRDADVYALDNRSYIRCTGHLTSPTKPRSFAIVDHGVVTALSNATHRAIPVLAIFPA